MGSVPGTSCPGKSVFSFKPLIFWLGSDPGYVSRLRVVPKPFGKSSPSVRAAGRMLKADTPRSSKDRGIFDPFVIQPVFLFQTLKRRFNGTETCSCHSTPAVLLLQRTLRGEPRSPGRRDGGGRAATPAPRAGRTLPRRPFLPARGA